MTPLFGRRPEPDNDAIAEHYLDIAESNERAKTVSLLGPDAIDTIELIEAIRQRDLSKRTMDDLRQKYLEHDQRFYFESILKAAGKQ